MTDYCCNPELPFYVFISDENEEKYWRRSLSFYSEATGGEYFLLNVGHYIHLDKPKLIAEKSRKIIEKVNED
ncbi:MAG: hypothetical protein ACLFPS_03170 [Clostridia bacterium]